MKFRLIPILLLSLGIASPLQAGDPPLKLDITPTFQHADFNTNTGTVTYHFTIDPHKDNFQICFGYDNPALKLSRLSCESIDGATQSPHFQRVYRTLPPGDYIGWAELYRVPNRVVSRIERPFQIIEAH